MGGHRPFVGGPCPPGPIAGYGPAVGPMHNSSRLINKFAGVKFKEFLTAELPTPELV